MFDKILAPTDGSSYALRAAEFGADLALKYAADVTLLYVAEVPPTLGIGPSEERQAEMRDELAELGREAMRKTVEVYRNKGVTPHEEVVFGSAVPTILRYAKEQNIDLIVIGSRGSGSGAIEQILIGSVAEGILHGAPCAVLMVRPQ